MGYDTELLFHEIELPGENLRPLRDSALESLSNDTCSWSYMLQYLFVRSVQSGDDIDLGISVATRKELTERFGDPPLRLRDLIRMWSRADSEEEECAPYTLEWYPFDGHVGKWRYTAEFVAWVSGFCTSGFLYEISWEDGGGLWGWEFGDGKYRDLELKPRGRWKRSSSSDAIARDLDP